MVAIKVGLGNKNGLPVVLFTTSENGASKVSFLHWHKGFRTQLSETVALDSAIEMSTSTLNRSISAISDFVTNKNNLGSHYLPTLVMFGYFIKTLSNHPLLISTLRKQEALLDKFIADTCAHHGEPFTKFNSLKEAAKLIKTEPPTTLITATYGHQVLAGGVFIQCTDSQYEFELTEAYVKVFNEKLGTSYYYETDFFSAVNGKQYSQSSLVTITSAIDAICNSILLLKGIVPTGESVINLEGNIITEKRTTLGFTNLFSS